MTKNLSKSLGIEYKNLTQSEQEIVSGIKKKLTTNELQKIISERVYHKWKRNSQVCNKLLILGATDSGKTAFLERYVSYL
ncbi:hypothetical protein M0813_09933 [Anaeramoeba flamelloides]|uniref:Uncharacterized protein n=1 Tax=Anaeramoeba flamelloides TaxID=1746091 RepID=A0ABQ8X3X5_9EUKA|nr:hypothetical protein M0813_09933 [Anaeramoeba flamelloides]